METPRLSRAERNEEQGTEGGQKPPAQRVLVSGQPAGSSRLPSAGQVWEHTEKSLPSIVFPPRSRGLRTAGQPCEQAVVELQNCEKIHFRVMLPDLKSLKEGGIF